MRRPAPLADGLARAAIASDLASTLFVEAGAGTGKTTSMVNRIVNMVESGVPIGRIAAVTFTEAAARELRSRLRTELERRGRARNDWQLIDAAAGVEGAAITTVHGFAHRLLSDHPVEAGLPPGFGVADEVASLLEFNEGWREFTEHIGDDLDLLELQQRASVLNIRLQSMSDVAARFNENWDVLDVDSLNPGPLGSVDVESLICEIVGLADGVCSLEGEIEMADGIGKLCRDANRQLQRDQLDQLHWLADGPPWPPSLVPLQAAGRPTLEGEIGSIVETIDRVRSRVEAELERCRIEVLNHFRFKVAEFVMERVAARQQSGELGFHDILVLARKLLREGPQVRRTLHQRYTRVLLDEFQDTDPIQIELAVLLTVEPDGPHNTVHSAWQALASDVLPGRLMVVGDPKQSIYRFRRADIGVYDDAERSLVDEPLRLTTNFRSVPGIISWLNSFYGHMIGDGEPGKQPPYTPLVPFRQAHRAAECPVLVMGGPHSRSTLIEQIRETEAADVAAVICRAMEQQWLTQRDDQWVPLRLSDIAVLIPSRLSLPALESAFGDANIPFRPETSSLVYATQEVRDVLAAVRAVADPTNTVGVVAALRSSLFAVGDDDLLGWYLAGGRWDYRAGSVPDGFERHPVACAFAELRVWHDRRYWDDPATLIDNIVRGRRLREVALAESRPRDRWRRYRFLTEQARQFTATTGGDLHDFVEWVDVQSSDLARVTEPIPAEPDDDAVRVLTIHGSKGLEFPMVVLAGAPTHDRSLMPGPPALFSSPDGPTVAPSQRKPTLNFEVDASVEVVLDDHERVRLHFVAATRARDILVVSAHHKQGSSSSAGKRTWEALKHCAGLYSRFERRGDEHYEAEPPTQLRLVGGDWSRLEKGWESEQSRVAGGVHSGRVWSPMTLAGELAASNGSSADEMHFDVGDDESYRRLRGEPGPGVGSAVRAVLEAVDFGCADNVEELAAFHADRFGMSDGGYEVAALVWSALGAPCVKLATANQHWRELYVAANVGEADVEGIVDLCIDGPDGLIVVDYRIDIGGSGSMAAQMDHLRVQAATYSLLLRHITGRDVSECRFVFIQPDGVTERSVNNVQETEAEITRFLSNLA